MSAVPAPPPLADLEPADQLLVGYGKSGAVGVFLADGPVSLRRGTAVIVRSARGLERGTVLGPATLRQARLLGAAAAGALLRPAGPADEARHAELARQADALFEAGRELVHDGTVAVDLIDVDLLFDGQLAVLQYVGAPDVPLDAFAQALEGRFGLSIHLENLAAPVESDHGSCDKPDCGRDAGGCTSCGTGGGCGTCGSGKVDLREYFGHLRTQMEQRRTPLL